MNIARIFPNTDLDSIPIRTKVLCLQPSGEESIRRFDGRPGWFVGSVVDRRSGWLLVEDSDGHRNEYNGLEFPVYRVSALPPVVIELFNNLPGGSNFLHRIQRRTLEEEFFDRQEDLASLNR